MDFDLLSDGSGTARARHVLPLMPIGLKRSFFLDTQRSLRGNSQFLASMDDVRVFDLITIILPEL